MRQGKVSTKSQEEFFSLKKTGYWSVSSQRFFAELGLHNSTLTFISEFRIVKP